MKWPIAILVVLSLGGTIIVAGSGGRFSQLAYLSSPTSNIPEKGQNFAVHRERSAGLVVMDAPNNFAGTIAKMGFVISEKLHFEELDTIAYRILPPTGMSYAVAEEKLNNRFPGIIVQNRDYDIRPASTKQSNSEK